MKCELRVFVPKGMTIPAGFEPVPMTDDFPTREYRQNTTADYRAISTLALSLNVKERAAYEARGKNSQDVGLIYYPHPQQM